MKKIILLAGLVYFLIAPFTYHPDTKLTLRYSALEGGRIWDIYGYIDGHKLDIPDFHYPPAHFWWLKIHYPISKFIGGQGFDEWLTSGSTQASFDENALKYNLAVKFPLLILGLVCGYFIFLIVKRAGGDNNKAKMAALFWYFNPVTLYALVAMGQNDVVAIFLFLGGMLFYEKKWWLSILLWGLASGVKSYPVIWGIMFLLVYEKKIFKLAGRIFLLVGTYVLILLPWLGKSYFAKAVLNSGLSQRMLVANIGIGFEKQILIVPMLLVLIAFRAWQNKSKNKKMQTSFVIFQSCLVILAFSHFNPQWMLWIIPFLSVWLFTRGVNKNDLLALLIIFGTWFVLTLGFDDRFLTWGLLAPISPSLLNFPSLVEFLRNKSMDMSMFLSLSQSVLAGVAIWYLSRKIRIKNQKSLGIKMKDWFVFMPWLLVFVLCILLNNINTIETEYSQGEGNSIYLSETVGKNWIYMIKPGLKYFEISLDNPSLSSQDRGVLWMTDNMGEVFEKEFSGFNAGANSWLRVDVPSFMSNSENIVLETRDVVTEDSLLKIRLDESNRWAVNFYYIGKAGTVGLINKLMSFWWWWLMMIVMSVFYVKVKEDQF
ncbi:hypothetical protein KJ909_02670 [Patescibacteria group bacterium]|nr:hypothetical protein [Patescibacteria group bacterium]